MIRAGIGCIVEGHGEVGALPVLLDSDEDCPAILGPELLRRVQAARSDLPSAVVLAKMEFEAWFLAAAGSLAGQRGLDPDLSPPPDPEVVAGPKQWLTQRMAGSRAYSETIDQPKLAARFDLGQARQASPSFDKCYREVSRLLARLRDP